MCGCAVCEVCAGVCRCVEGVHAAHMAEASVSSTGRRLIWSLHGYDQANHLAAGGMHSCTLSASGTVTAWMADSWPTRGKMELVKRDTLLCVLTPCRSTAACDSRYMPPSVERTLPPHCGIVKSAPVSGAGRTRKGSRRSGKEEVSTCSQRGRGWSWGWGWG